MDKIFVLSIFNFTKSGGANFRNKTFQNKELAVDTYNSLVRKHQEELMIRGLSGQECKIEMGINKYDYKRNDGKCMYALNLKEQVVC